jgi:hypothetical protein
VQAHHMSDDIYAQIITNAIVASLGHANGFIRKAGMLALLKLAKCGKTVYWMICTC